MRGLEVLRRGEKEYCYLFAEVLLNSCGKTKGEKINRFSSIWLLNLTVCLEGGMWAGECGKSLSDQLGCGDKFDLLFWNI